MKTHKLIRRFKQKPRCCEQARRLITCVLFDGIVYGHGNVNPLLNDYLTFRLEGFHHMNLYDRTQAVVCSLLNRGLLEEKANGHFDLTDLGVLTLTTYLEHGLHEPAVD